jgi:hypothetical protein
VRFCCLNSKIKLHQKNETNKIRSQAPVLPKMSYKAMDEPLLLGPQSHDLLNDGVGLDI